MPPRIPRAPGLPFGGGLNLAVVAGAAYFVSEHGQGRRRPHLLCPLCLLDKIAPAPRASGGPSPAEPRSRPDGLPSRAATPPRSQAPDELLTKTVDQSLRDSSSHAPTDGGAA